jgi:AraC family transcriptional regulator
MQRLRQATLGQAQRRRTIGAMQIVASGYAADQRLPLHEHTTAYLCLVTRGAYLQQAGGRDSECTQGLLLVHPEGHRHANRFGTSGACCLNIHPGAAFADDPAMRHLLADHRQLRLPDEARLRGWIERELAATDEAAPLALQAAVLELAALACRRHGADTAPAWLARVLERLHDDPGTMPSLSALAVLAGVHPAHLARSFQRTQGVSVGEYLRRLRIGRACTALADPRRSIAEVAADAGFADQSHFARVFRRVTGEPPRAWRQRTQKTD